MTIAEAVESAKIAIERDINAGSVPSEINSFEQLHAFADANQYVVDALQIVDFTEDDVKNANAVIFEINRWLQRRYSELH